MTADAGRVSALHRQVHRHYHGRWHYSTAIEGDEDSAAQLKRRSLSHAQQSFGSRSHGPAWETQHDDTVDDGIVGIVRQSITSMMHKVKGHSKVVPPCRSDLVLWYVRHSYEMPTQWALRFLCWSWGLLRGAVVGHAQPRSSRFDIGEGLRKFEGYDEDHKAEAAAPEEESDEGAADALSKRLYAAAGLLGIYVTWAVFTWFIFTYGMLVYRQLGDQAQRKFTTSWGINFGLDSAQQWKDVVSTAVKTTVIITILDLLYILGNKPWLEDYLDMLSIQSALLTGQATTWRRRTVLLVQQQKRLSDD